MADITMPQLGETVTEGTITRWLKQVGDQVTEDEVLFEVSTDKVDSEVPSPATGYVTEILVPEGETVDVGVRLAVISADQANAVGAADPANGAGAADPADLTSARPATDGPAAEQPPGPAGQGVASSAPPPVGAGPDEPGEDQGRLTAGIDRGPGEADGEADGDGSRWAGRVLSPVVRRLLADNGIDPADVQGTGTHGRITRADALALIDHRSRVRVGGTPTRQSPARPAAPGEAAATQERGDRPLARSEDGGRPTVRGNRDEVIAFSNIRRRTAEHMVRSKATSAHTLVAVEADFEGIEQVRRSHRERFKAEHGASLTYLPFVARAVVDGLRAFPMLNASVGDDELVVHRELHLGIAVALEAEGLIVPVVHGADGKRLVALARDMADLAQRARTRRLGADDIAGGTFTITNPGPFGTFLTVPIINQPQVAILSTDGVKRRPVVVPLPGGGEAIAVHSVGILALSFDHRAVDGAYAAGFLARVREVIESRDWAEEL